MMKENLLPEYLRMRVNAAPDDKHVFVMGDVRVTVMTPCLLRIEQGAYTDEATLTAICRNFCPCEASVSQEGSETVLRTQMLELRCRHGEPLQTGLTVRRTAAPAFFWRYGDKPLHNLGGTTSTLDTIDGACEIEDGVCSLDGFAVIDDSKTPLMLKNGWFAPRKPCSDVYFFGYGHDYTQAVKDYCRLTGAPQMLPAYALGNWWSRYHAYTEESYLALMDRFMENDVPLSVGIVDMDWHLTRGENRTYHEGWTGYTWNEELFPDYKRFLDGLHARGLKTALNLHPALGVRSYEAQYAQMAAAMGMDGKSGEPVRFNCLDPRFLKAYFEVLHFPYEKDGVDFWWLDWQQGTDYEKIAGENYAGKGLEGISPLWMLNHMHDLASRRNGGRGMIFSRYGGYGSQRYPIGFSGDTYITWASLAFQPYFTATASNIGYGWWSHDIGGHMGGVRDDELTARWVQFGVFSPIFRLHSTSSLFSSREPWTYNKRAELVMERFMRLRHRLFPYLYTMNRRASEELLPLLRPMYHVHPECAQAYKVPNEYWFGSEMIAAPITEPADKSDLARAEVWLPEGVWTDAFTGYVYRGNQTLLAYRPLEQMPLLMKAGAIIPMQAHIHNSRALGGAKQMEVYVAPGANGSFALYEDDGKSLDYQQGAFCTTRMTLDWQDNRAVFTIHPAQGKVELVPKERSYAVHLRGFKQGCRFDADGQTIPAVYDEKTATYTVTLFGVRADSGAAFAVTNDAQLTHDNSDCRARIIDLLVRMQGPNAEKAQLLERADAALAMIAEGRRDIHDRLCADRCRNMGGAMLELLAQL